MLSIVKGVVLLYVVYYTLLFAKKVWKEGNKFATVWIGLLAGTLLAIPAWQMWMK